MKIQTLQFGELEIRAEEILHFPKGILGFLDEYQFFLFSNSQITPFMWLQSVKTTDLAFVVLDPWLVIPDYEITLSEEIKKELSIVNQNQVMILGIVTMPESFKNMTINLRAPLVINTVERLAEQFILPDDRYEIRYPVLSE